MRRRYSDDDVAAALAALDANEGNVLATCQQLDIPQSTLQSWAQGRAVGERITRLRYEKKQDLADKFESLAHKMIEHASDETVIKAMGGQAAVTAAGIAVDKMRLLRGLPTEIISIIPDLVAALELRGLKASDVFESMIRRLTTDAGG